MFVRKSKFLFSLLSGVIAGVLAFTLTVGTTIPDRFSVVEGENFSLESGLPVDVAAKRGFRRFGGGIGCNRPAIVIRWI